MDIYHIDKFFSVTTNMATIKSGQMIHLSDKTIYRIEYKRRYDYIYNPITAVYEKQAIDEYTDVEFDDMEYAYRLEESFRNVWTSFLKYHNE